jgi:F-type H+-transporting ATPase subunit gamma
MARIREIRKRMTAVRTIARITKTMQMIATAKFTAAMARAKASRPYTNKIRQLVAEVAAAVGDVSHPLILSPAEPVKRELVLVISSDRGLCGAYNGTVLRAANQHIRLLKSGGTEAVVETSGKKAVGFFKFAKIDVAEKHTLGDKPSYDAVEKLAQRYLDEFAAGKFDAIHVAYMKFVSKSRQRPEVMQLLPIKPPEAAKPADGSTAPAAGAKSLYEFSPSSEELLDSLLPQTVKVSLYQAFSDAVVSEQVMRMIAMKAATDNAKDLGKLLNRQYNRARQAKITTELTEIVSGASALE